MVANILEKSDKIYYWKLRQKNLCKNQVWLKMHKWSQKSRSSKLFKIQSNSCKFTLILTPWQEVDH